MTIYRRAILASSPALLALGTFACWAKEPCSAGYTMRSDYNCEPIPATLAADADATAAEASSPSDEAGTAGDASTEEAAAATTFGKTCTAQSDCGGDAPVCAAPHAPYCTQIMCNPGEANAGVCPPGWTCFQTPQVSACVRN